MAEVKHAVEVTLDVTRCYECGRFWGIERGVHGSCPNCKHKRLDARWAELVQANRRANALRGVIAKMKRGRR